MAKYTNTSPQILVMPRGEEVAPGEAIEVADSALKNEGVKFFLSKNWLTKGTTKKTEQASE